VKWRDQRRDCRVVGLCGNPGAPAVPYPTPSVTPISGSCRSLVEHPVQAVLYASFDRRAIWPRAFHLLAQRPAPLTAPSDWDSTYSGCFMGQRGSYTKVEDVVPQTANALQIKIFTVGIRSGRSKHKCYRLK
jgi:hypothetical protein